MDIDDKVVAAIENCQATFKVITDVGLKGILFHLALSAFSVSVLFQQKLDLPRAPVITFNVAATALALVAIGFLTKDSNRLVRRMQSWHTKLGLDLDASDMSGLVNCGRLYVVFCTLLLSFWVSLYFVVS